MKYRTILSCGINISADVGKSLMDDEWGTDTNGHTKNNWKEPPINSYERQQMWIISCPIFEVHFLFRLGCFFVVYALLFRGIFHFLSSASAATNHMRGQSIKPSYRLEFISNLFTFAFTTNSLFTLVICFYNFGSICYSFGFFVLLLHFNKLILPTF